MVGSVVGAPWAEPSLPRSAIPSPPLNYPWVWPTHGSAATKPSAIEPPPLGVLNSWVGRDEAECDRATTPGCGQLMGRPRRSRVRSSHHPWVWPTHGSAATKPSAVEPPPLGVVNSWVGRDEAECGRATTPGCSQLMGRPRRSRVRSSHHPWV